MIERKIKYIYHVDSKSINKFLKENSNVILGVYEERCTVSSLFGGMLSQLSKNIENSYIILTISRDEYIKSFNLSKVMIYPKIILFKNSKMIKTIEGFMNFNKVKEKILA